MTETTSFDLKHEALTLESSAEWRRRRAERYPHDAQRNLEAAALLDLLAKDVRALEGSELHRQASAVSRFTQR